VEIDYCPKCRGVWLDRGELDKIIERSSQPAPTSRRDDDDWDDDDKYKYQYGKKKSKTKSIFGEIFDF
jgi:Zn-finger nucleic acid-binding protein